MTTPYGVAAKLATCHWLDQENNEEATSQQTEANRVATCGGNERALEGGKARRWRGARVESASKRCSVSTRGHEGDGSSRMNSVLLAPDG